MNKDDGSPRFTSKHHKKTIANILSTLGEVNDIELFWILYITKEMGLNRMDIGGGVDNRQSK